MADPLTIPLPDPAERAALAERWSALPAMRALGARADFADPGAVRVVIDRLQPFHRGGLGTEAVNGAVIAGLCDAAVGMVGHFQALGSRVGTAQLSIQFLRPVRGETVAAVGRLTRAGASLVFARAEIEDARGTVCAVCDGIVAIVGREAERENVAL
ncbi:MAG TPA: PaaI family thioesterase [Gemmatimonadales bacterium]|nr:PaaI family thioesterase [Gemmatimonadales bacterium]